MNFTETVLLDKTLKQILIFHLIESGKTSRRISMKVGLLLTQNNDKYSLCSEILFLISIQRKELLKINNVFN